MPIYCPPLPALPPPCPHTFSPFSVPVRFCPSKLTDTRPPPTVCWTGPLARQRPTAQLHNSPRFRVLRGWPGRGRETREVRVEYSFHRVYATWPPPGLPEGGGGGKGPWGEQSRIPPGFLLSSLLRLSLPARTVAHGTPARNRERTHTVRVYCICCRVHRSLLFRLTVYCKQEAFSKIVFFSFRVC